MDLELLVKIAMPIVTLFLGIILNRLVENREKLIAHLGYIASHKVASAAEGKNPSVVNTHSLIIKNSGRKVAKNVRLGHSFLPDINVYPDVEYSINDLPGGSKEIIFPTLIPKKEVTVSYLYFPPDNWSQINTHIESDEGPAKFVNVLLQPQPKPWALKLIWFFIITGIIGSVYSAIEIIRWLVI